ncbi:hypothetical protein PLESTM_000082100 [Pleodorina starrii]|nr:hypothetical protein PLESTM_000082100 [Pleodorina starrii]
MITSRTSEDGALRWLQLQQLVLEVSEPGTAKGVDRVLSAVGHRLRVLEMRVAPRGTLPAVGLEDCTALDELRLVLDMNALAPLGPLRMRGDEAPPAVAAIASLGPHLRSLELLGSALPRLLDPPHRLAGLSELTALTKLRVDVPPGLLAAAGGAAAGGGVDVGGSAAGGEGHAAELRWRAVPLASSLGSLAEVHLGRSYECTVYDMAVLARAPALTLLACRNIVLPPTRVEAAAAAGGGAAALLYGQPPPPVVPLPPQLRELQVRRLPSAPVLAALEALPSPGLQSLKCRAFDKAAAAAATAAAAAAAAAAAVTAATAAAAASASSTSACLAVAEADLGGGTSDGWCLASAPASAAPRSGAAAATAAIAQGPSGVEGLRLALIGSSCDGESIEADPWVSDVAMAAFRIIQRLLFAHAPPPPPRHAAAAAAAAALPALIIRPFERSGRGGGGGAVLRGPYAGSWLAALAPLGAAGLSGLQLRSFEFEAGDLQLLRVAVPELRICELRGCTATHEDLLHLRDWLQRPGWGGCLRSDRLHDQLLLSQLTLERTPRDAAAAVELGAIGVGAELDAAASPKLGLRGGDAGP